MILETTKSGAKGPGQRRLADAIKAAGGYVREFAAPKAGQLADWIKREADDRGLALGPGSAKELSERVGGFVQQNDAERPFQTRTASMELDKLGLYRGSAPITVDDVRALVAEAVPGTIWGFVDAVAERRTSDAIALLERLLDATPEPVLVVVLHRRIRELIEISDRVAGGEKLPAIAKALGIKSEFRVRNLSGQARAWTTTELIGALEGLVELDAMVKGAPGTTADAAQRRLAFTLWVMDHVPRRERRSA